MVSDKIPKIAFGGWYQRTTLHLSEIQNFLLNKKSNLELDPETLNKNHKKLDLKSINRKTGYLEYLEIWTNSGILIRYYEDGLYILEVDSEKIEEAKDKIKKYFSECFKPAVEYLFSLGAPTPKILANIKEEHPTVIGFVTGRLNSFKVDEKKYGKVYLETLSKNAKVLKTSEYIIVALDARSENELRNLIEMQIFFREFKWQLHKYLDIHRKVWEEIADIKEKKVVKGSEVALYRSRLESYKKTISIIRNRINQMRPYAQTRATISKELKVEGNLIALFEYRFEDLFNTLEYIREIWNMTIDYVNNALEIIDAVNNNVNAGGITSIRILASIGVVTAVLGYLGKDTFPTISTTGAIYLFGLGITAFIVDFVLRKKAKMKKYTLRFVEHEKEI